MQRIICLMLCTLLLGACGTPDSLKGNSGAPPEPRFVEVSSGISVTLEPIYTPLKDNGILTIDIYPGRHLSEITLLLSDTVQLIVTRPTFAHEKYLINFDPTMWTKFIAGQEVPFQEATEPYPPGGWTLKPKQPGYTPVIVAIYEDDQVSCATCATENASSRSYNFHIEP